MALPNIIEQVFLYSLYSLSLVVDTWDIYSFDGYKLTLFQLFGSYFDRLCSSEIVQKCKFTFFGISLRSNAGGNFSLMFLPYVGQVFQTRKCCLALARKCHKSPTIPKSNDSKYNHAKNGNPWYSFRTRTNNRNNCLNTLYHSLIRAVIIIFTKCKSKSMPKFTNEERK